MTKKMRESVAAVMIGAALMLLSLAAGNAGPFLLFGGALVAGIGLIAGAAYFVREGRES